MPLHVPRFPLLFPPPTGQLGTRRVHLCALISCPLDVMDAGLGFHQLKTVWEQHRGLSSEPRNFERGTPKASVGRGRTPGHLALGPAGVPEGGQQKPNPDSA